MKRITELLRLGLLLLLLWLAIAPPAPGPGADVVELGTAGDVARLHPLPAARAYLRRSVSAPGHAELEALTALAERAPLLAIPPTRPHLHADPPADPLAGRAAAIRFHLLGSAGESRLVRLRDAAGLLDSATVRLDGNGEAAGSFTVRPAAAGWHVWTLATDSAADVRTAAWVGQASPLRVLIAPGLASWEGREVARALERGGARVTLLQPLGRDLAIQGAPASLPVDPDALREWDAVIVLAGASLDNARRAALDTWVAAGGGGVLIAGPTAGATVVDSIDARRIDWAEWPGIPPLPPIEASVAGTRVDASTATSRVIAADADGTPRLVLRTPGRGRAAELGFTETWRWGLEAGRTDELSAFWLGLAEWLAGGIRSGFHLSADPAAAPTGTPVHVTAITFTGDSLPSFLYLRRPDGLEERVPLERAYDGSGRGAFIALQPGVHTLELPARAPAGPGLAAGQAPAAVHMASDPDGGRATDTASAARPVTPTRAWPRLALLAHRSGGAIVAADSLDGRAGLLAGQRSTALLPLLLLVAALGVAFAEWLLRRLRGQA
jgi:hypothetical protein